MYASNQSMVVHRLLMAHKTSSFYTQKVGENPALVFDSFPMGREIGWFLREFLNENLNELPYYNEFLLKLQIWISKIELEIQFISWDFKVIKLSYLYLNIFHIDLEVY